MQGRRWNREGIPWIKILVSLGLTFRFYHYLRNPSIWHDEAALIVNVLGKGFREMLGPLFLSEAAPPLFLWLEKIVTSMVGDSAAALRFLPFAASCASLLLMVAVVRRIVNPAGVPWAILLFGCSDRLLWHCCEAKPYALDVAIAIAQVALFAWGKNLSLNKRLMTFIPFAPLAIFLSFPGCFLCGGFLVAFLPDVWKARRLSSAALFGSLGLLILVCFAFLYFGPIHAQRCESMNQCWVKDFPDFSHPGSIPGWILWATMEIVSYSLRPVGEGYCLFVILGAVSFWRRNKKELLLLLVVPIALALTASFLKAYPYSGARVLVYSAPAIILLSCEGVGLSFVFLRRRYRAFLNGKEKIAALPGYANRAALGALALYLSVPLFMTLYRIPFPWKRADCAGAAQYVCSHRKPSEKVIADHWEYIYYFRNLGDRFASPESLCDETKDRLWVIITAATREERKQVYAKYHLEEMKTLDEREFSRNSVYLVSRK